MTPTVESLEAREALTAHRDEVDALLARYGASNPRLFGSVARGDAGPLSDIDLLVDLEDPRRRTLMRLGGLNEGLRRVLGRPVDVVAPASCAPACPGRLSRTRWRYEQGGPGQAAGHPQGDRPVPGVPRPMTSADRSLSAMAEDAVLLCGTSASSARPSTICPTTLPAGTPRSIGRRSSECGTSSSTSTSAWTSRCSSTCLTLTYRSSPTCCRRSWRAGRRAEVSGKKVLAVTEHVPDILERLLVVLP